MTTILELTCRDPVVARDGRPFGAGQGNRMRSAGWLLPSVVAGSLRSMLGKVAQREFSRETALELLQAEVAGAFPVAEGQLCLPAPEDCIVHPDRGLIRTTPQATERGGCDWPAAGLRPVMLPEEQAPEDFKPEEGSAWWPADRLARWLVGDDVALDHRFLVVPQVEERTHVQLDADTGAAEEGNLFTSAALPLTHLGRYGAPADGSFGERYAEIRLSARVRAGQWCGETAARLDSFHPLGGERRLVHWRATAEAPTWSCPQVVRGALAGAARVRMILATPAIFCKGWKPGWLDDELIGSPPAANVTLRLVGVRTERWRAVSGWSLANLPGQPRGPKPVRRVVPAGGAYFFEIVEGTGAGLEDHWLESVSDGEQDRRDGFGLAVWGVW